MRMPVTLLRFVSTVSRSVAKIAIPIFNAFFYELLVRLNINIWTWFSELEQLRGIAD